MVDIPPKVEMQPANNICFVEDYQIGFSRNDIDGTFYLVRFFGVGGKEVNIALQPDAAMQLVEDLNAIRKAQSS